MAISPKSRDAAKAQRSKWVVFSLLTVVLSACVIEAGVRTILAMRVGPNILLYGTAKYRNRLSVPAAGALSIAGDVNAHRKGEHEAVGNTDLAVRTAGGGYQKFYPSQPKVDFDEHGNRFTVSINAHGFRGADWSVQKPAGVLRVVTLGASSTFGYYDRDDETYPALLERKLNSAGTGRFEVLNLGIPHLTSSEILELFFREALPLEPDVVTFYEGINDASQAPEAVWQEKSEEAARSGLRRARRAVAAVSSLRGVYVWVRSHSLAVTLVDQLAFSNVVRFNAADVDRHMQGKSERFLANLAVMRDSSRARGIEFVVITQQARSMAIEDVRELTYAAEAARIRSRLGSGINITHQEKTFLAHDRLMSDLREWARREGVTLVDAAAALDNDRDALLSWVHLSARGNAKIAEALAPRILELARARPARLGATP